MASALIDQTVKDLNDHDTAVIIMRTASGRQAVITNYRKATYGYDQRIEVVGELGMLQAHNRRATHRPALDRHHDRGQGPAALLLHRALQGGLCSRARCRSSIALEQGAPCSPGFEDGRRALLLANAAYESIKTGTTSKLAG